MIQEAIELSGLDYKAIEIGGNESRHNGIRENA